MITALGKSIKIPSQQQTSVGKFELPLGKIINTSSPDDGVLELSLINVFGMQIVGISAELCFGWEKS